MDDKVATLVDMLRRFNEAYRSGAPLVSDSEYDRFVERLREMDPENPFLQAVEPETFDGKVKVRHPVAMLSTEKAYTKEQIERFLERVNKAAREIGVKDFLYRVTPKLDGLAGRDDGKCFASRGNGIIGYEISGAFEKGVVPVGGRGKGIGEIVVKQSYFETHLSEAFEHPRNMVVGIVSSDTLNEFAQKALADGVVRFVPYSELPSWEGSAEALLEQLEAVTSRLTEAVDYPMDGLVAEVTDERLKSYMGATSHHYRWQIAIKSKGDTATTAVVGITWQVGRTGNITPVMEVEPVSLSGATIRRVTAHNAGLVKKKGIGAGSIIEIIRSGEVIPKLEKVLESAETVVIPSQCPSCEEPIQWVNDFLKCRNPDCRAQTEQRISHWFKTLGTADWFGIQTIRRLVEEGFDSLAKIYTLNEEDFLSMGFGPVQSKNLVGALQSSRTRPVEDWRLLAAFGIPDLGPGDSRKLLSRFRLDSILELTAEQIEQIEGFGRKTACSVVEGIERIKGLIRHMTDLGFKTEETVLLEDLRASRSPIAGKSLVFTGKMRLGSREQMQAEARLFGANVQSAVSGKTDYLVCGENVGNRKIEKAREKGVEIISEDAFYEMVGTDDSTLKKD